MDTRRLASASLLGLSLACRSPSAGAPSPDAGAPVPPIPSGRRDPIQDAREESLELARRWQGAWVVRDAEYPGSIQAWNVRATMVTVYDATDHRTEEEGFTVPSPCRISRTRRIGVDPELDARPVEDVITIDTFVFAGDGLHVAMTPAGGGFRRGAIITACVGDRLYTFDDHLSYCDTWSLPMSEPPLARSARCRIEPGPASTSFVLERVGWGEAVRLTFYGDALLSPALLAEVAEPTPSFREATDRADALANASAKPDHDGHLVPPAGTLPTSISERTYGQPH